MQVSRIFPIIMLGMLLVTTPLTAATGDMSVAAFLAKADNLKAKGFLALGSSDIALLQSEAKAAGAALIGIFHDRAAREAVADRHFDMTPAPVAQEEYAHAR